MEGKVVHVDRRHARLGTPIGTLTLVAQDGALTGLYYPGHWHVAQDADFGPAVDAEADPVLGQAARELGQYFDGTRERFQVPVATHGDRFSEQLWALLCEIPYGATTTYGALAAKLALPRQARRVGQAVGRNPVSILIPCHRVVGADGSLTGYAGGIERKRALLALEEPRAEADSRLF